MLTALKARCPDCGATVRVDGGSAATFVVTRTCRKCGARWHMTVKPLFEKPGACAHAVTFVRKEPSCG
jgi:transposase-like protein